MANHQFSLDYACSLDRQDPLRNLRSLFYIPRVLGRESIYFSGNSLGLQPKSVITYIEQELLDWEQLGVEGHFEAKHPWKYYHHDFAAPAARLVGAKPLEVVLMNTLTANLHFLMATFYRPTLERYKIIVEGQLFPSDHYAVESQLILHGFNPEIGIIEMMPRDGEHTLRTDDILEQIDQNKDELALILLGGVNYYTGQFFDLKSITEAGHQAGSVVGFDLAHAVGNVILNLHDWQIDFAAWCTYKYLNSGPGSVGGAFIHEKHATNPLLPRLAGWWGYDEETRFEMKKGFVPMNGADGWQVSNAQIMNMVAHKASLHIFDEVGMEKLRMKSEKLTGYFEWCLNKVNLDNNLGFEIITPSNPLERGCQLSILTGENGKNLFEKLKSGGVIADWRHPNVIRVAPVPLYNSFEDVYRFSVLLNA
jgi:kynureninase